MSNEVDKPEVKGCKGQHGEYGAIGTIKLQRPASEVYHFLTKVEAQPTWNSSVKRADVLRSTTTDDVETKQVQQVMGWGFLALRGNFTLQLTMHEDARARTVHTEMTSQAPTAESSKDTSPASSPASSRSNSFSSDASGSISGRSNASGGTPEASPPASPGSADGSEAGGNGRGGFMKRFSSRMTVQELGPDSALLEMQLFMLPSIYVPFGIRSLVGGQVRRQLGGLLNSVKQHVESPDFKPSGSDGSGTSQKEAAFAPAALKMAV